MYCFRVGCLRLVFQLLVEITKLGQPSFVKCNTWHPHGGKSFQLSIDLRIERIVNDNRAYRFFVEDTKGELRPRFTGSGFCWKFSSPNPIRVTVATSETTNEVLVAKITRRSDGAYVIVVVHEQKAAITRPSIEPEPRPEFDQTVIHEVPVSKIDHFRRPNDKPKTKEDLLREGQKINGRNNDDENRRKPIRVEEPKEVEIVPQIKSAPTREEIAAMGRVLGPKFVQRLNLTSFLL